MLQKSAEKSSAGKWAKIGRKTVARFGREMLQSLPNKLLQSLAGKLLQNSAEKVRPRKFGRESSAEKIRCKIRSRKVAKFGREKLQNSAEKICKIRPRKFLQSLAGKCYFLRLGKRLENLNLWVFETSTEASTLWDASSTIDWDRVVALAIGQVFTEPSEFVKLRPLVGMPQQISIESFRVDRDHVVRRSNNVDRVPAAKDQYWQISTEKRFKWHSSIICLRNVIRE